MECKATHTKYQPTDQEFRCLKCGADPNGKNYQGKLVDPVDSYQAMFGLGFVIEEAAENVDDDCSLLHNEDLLKCYTCGSFMSGSKFANQLAKKHDLVSCPCCKGAGLLPSKKALEVNRSMKQGE